MFLFLERMIYSDFAGLKDASHFFAHKCILRRSSFNRYAAFIGSSTIIYNLVSSSFRMHSLVLNTLQ